MKLSTNITNYGSDPLGLVETAAAYLNDRTHKMWSKPELVVHINEAQWKIAAGINAIHKEHFIGSSTTPVQGGQRFYTMPPDLAQLVGLEIIENANDREAKSLVTVHISDRKFYTAIQQATNRDEYRYYFVAGQNFELMPEAAVTDGDEIRAFYVKRLTELVNDEDVSEIALQHHGIIAMDAARLAQIKTKQTNAQLEKMRAEAYEALMGEIRIYTIPREERVEPFFGSGGPQVWPFGNPPFGNVGF